MHQLLDSTGEAGKFVIYGYCISFGLTFRRISQPYYIKPGELPSKYRAPYTTLSLIFGWWGFPWGPIYTVDMLKINAKNGGGVDVTGEILIKLQDKYAHADMFIPFAEDIMIDYEDNELISNNGSQVRTKD